MADALNSVPSLTGPFVIGIDGKHLTDTDRRRLKHPHVGGVILFTRNYENPAQLLELTAEIRAVRSPPLHISVDHEGGRVQRFRPGFTVLPAMRRLGALWDRDVLFACRVATSVGYVIGSELRAHGVDFSYAPVVDVEWGRSEVIGDRSLHRDARVVTMLSSHLNQGLALAGMANCCKHWPGHGWAVADSHVAIPDDTRPIAEILAADGAPYRWLGVGITSVMAAHIVYSQLDPRPAGFAARWIQDKLRGELGYTGAVFSDDLLMVGASGIGGVVERARAALAAGCDLVLICKGVPEVDDVLEQVAWTRTPLFDQRAARLIPRGPALPMDELRATDAYRAAQQDLARWAELLA